MTALFCARHMSWPINLFNETLRGCCVVTATVSELSEKVVMCLVIVNGKNREKI